jgi:hypothetical protein
VQAFKELEKQYTEKEHVLDNVLNSFTVTVGISDSKVEDAGGCSILPLSLETN